VPESPWTIVFRPGLPRLSIPSQRHHTMQLQVTLVSIGCITVKVAEFAEFVE
jgi:hypothetical protein